MSRPTKRSGSYGLIPCTGCVVDRWKYSGTISTSPPIATTRMTSTISRVGVVSILSCVSFIVRLPDSSVRDGGRDLRLDGLALADRLHHVPGHQDHPCQVHQPAEQTDPVEGVGRFHA